MAKRIEALSINTRATWRQSGFKSLMGALFATLLSQGCDAGSQGNEDLRDNEEAAQLDETAAEQQAHHGSARPNVAAAEPGTVDGIPIADSCNGQICGTPCDPCGVVEGACEADSVGYCDVNGTCQLTTPDLLECPNWNECALGDVNPSDDGCNVCTCELVDGQPQMVCTHEVCAKSCITNADCGITEYCAHSIGSCGGNGQSHCQEIPNSCTTGGSEVCGCDGLIWDNPCVAANHGVSVSTFGGCGTETPKYFGCGHSICHQDEACQITAATEEPAPGTPAYVETCVDLLPGCSKPSCDCVTLGLNQRCEEIGGHVFVIDLTVG